MQRLWRIRNSTVVFNFLNNVSTGLFCSGYDNDRRKSSRSFVVLLTIKRNRCMTCFHAFSRALQLETGHVYVLQGVLLVHCLFLLLLAKVISESSLSMVCGGSLKSRGLLLGVGMGEVIWVLPLPEGVHMDDQNWGHTRCHSSPPHPPPPARAIAPQTINKTFSIKMLRHEDRKHSFKANLLVLIFVFACSQRLKYLTSITNLIEWAIYVSALYYVFPVCACKSYFKSMAAAFSLFFAWLNLVLYFRRLVIPFFSITPHAANTR